MRNFQISVELPVCRLIYGPVAQRAIFLAEKRVFPRAHRYSVRVALGNRHPRWLGVDIASGNLTVFKLAPLPFLPSVRLHFEKKKTKKNQPVWEEKASSGNNKNRELAPVSVRGSI